MNSEQAIKQYCREDGLRVLDVHKIAKNANDVIRLMLRIDKDNKQCIMFFDFSKTEPSIYNLISATTNIRTPMCHFWHGKENYYMHNSRQIPTKASFMTRMLSDEVLLTCNLCEKEFARLISCHQCTYNICDSCSTTTFFHSGYLKCPQCRTENAIYISVR